MEGEGGCAATATRTTNAQGVHTVSIALKTLPKGVANAREVTFHWGVMREKTGKTWQVLPSELHPPNTEYYKGDKAMRSAFPVRAPVNLVPDPQANSVAFALYVDKSGEWINAVGGGNFEIDLAAHTPPTVADAAARAADRRTVSRTSVSTVPAVAAVDCLFIGGRPRRARFVLSRSGAAFSAACARVARKVNRQSSRAPSRLASIPTFPHLPSRASPRSIPRTSTNQNNDPASSTAFALGGRPRPRLFVVALGSGARRARAVAAIAPSFARAASRVAADESFSPATRASFIFASFSSRASFASSRDGDSFAATIVNA